MRRGHAIQTFKHARTQCWVSSVLGQLVKTKAQRERFFGPYPVIDEGADPVIGPVMERVREEI